MLISTPQGDIPVQNVQVGTLVWTVDKDGQRVAQPVLQISHVPVPVSHIMLKVLLSDGRVFRASTGHPTADGRDVGSLVIGDSLDSAQVIRIDHDLYADGFTYDILPTGITGTYWANGVLLGSTLR